MDEASVLKDLTEGVRNQEDLQRDISHQANLLIIEQEDERDKKRIDKVTGSKDKLLAQKQTHERRLNAILPNTPQSKHIQNEIDKIDSEIADLDGDILQIQERIAQRHKHDGEVEDAAHDIAGNRRLPNESHRDFLIRTGKITPFARMPDREADTAGGALTDVLMDAEDEANLDEEVKEAGPQSHQNLRLPGFVEAPDGSSAATSESEQATRSRKKRRMHDGSAKNSDAESPYTPAESEDIELGEDEYEDDEERPRKRAIKGKSKANDDVEDLTKIDDGNEKMYQSRLKSWIERRSRARRNRHLISGEQGSGHSANENIEDDEEEWFKPSPDAPDHEFENGLKVPGDIYPALFDYQKTGVQWLGELYEQQVGGIVGDEMGLGKTIQIISFLAGLHYSKKLDKPVIVVAPATVLRQWVNEFHRWWPPFRVSILHTSGSGMLNVSKETHVEDEVERHNYGYKDKKASSSSAKRIVNRVVKEGHVLVTTYAGLQTYGDILIPVQWGYAVLDEGHKIRNPNTSITIYCKELQTPNRIILSGTPMQNNLIELWSLFDFVYPMRLGTLVNFRNQFEQPIKIGGYANATNLQILTATKCAETLKEAISPYLLQRLKADVAADLPKKSEQVVFCKLTKPQRDAYEAFLASDEMTSILQRTRQSLYGIDILRKICNHPDLLDPRLRKKPGYKWGNPNKSGKMHVVKALLEIWKKAGDKILLFSQGVQMLDIIEHFVKSLDGFNYLRMDGGTNIKDRQSMVDRFNNDPDLHVFLLTTKVGGLGVNLTGANRVIIFDPDWNPSTDVQARERAWRLGQKKEVTIFRLMTAGTIEEKIYHRQIFKQMLADKVMKDPKQQQRFVLKDLYDLFTLGTPDEETTETGELFKGSEVKFRKDLPDRSHRHDFAPSSQIKVPDNDNNAYGGGPAPRPIAEPVSKVTATALPTLAAPATLAKAPEADYRSIEGVSKLEEFYDESEEMPKDEESRIMEGIFARSGVHSVLQHDQIVNGKRVVQADRGMIEREAKRIAAEAAAELKRAGEAARHVPIGTVTWTGEHGEGGRPQVRRRGAPASGAVLGNLAARQGMTGFTSNSQSPGGSRGRTPADSRPARGEDFIKLIPEYIKLQGGSVPSQMLVVHFGGMCKTPQDSALFKAVLEQVAELKKGGARLRGRWELKEEFK